MAVPGFVFNPMMLAVEGTVIGFVIAVPVGPAAALCIRRSITVGAVAGYLTGIGAALGDAVFGAVAAFGLELRRAVRGAERGLAARHRRAGAGDHGLDHHAPSAAHGRRSGGGRPRAPGRHALSLRDVELLHHRVQSAHHHGVRRGLRRTQSRRRRRQPAGRHRAGRRGVLRRARLVGDPVHRRGGAAPAFHRARPAVAEPDFRRGDPGLRPGRAGLAAAAAVGGNRPALDLCDRSRRSCRLPRS